jgi:hypothetical protein
MGWMVERIPRRECMGVPCDHIVAYLAPLIKEANGYLIAFMELDGSTR